MWDLSTIETDTQAKEFISQCISECKVTTTLDDVGEVALKTASKTPSYSWRKITISISEVYNLFWYVSGIGLPEGFKEVRLVGNHESVKIAFDLSYKFHALYRALLEKRYSNMSVRTEKLSYGKLFADEFSIWIKEIGKSLCCSLQTPVTPLYNRCDIVPTSFGEKLRLVN